MEIKFNEEQLLNLAVVKICDQYIESDELSKRVESLIQKRLNEVFSERLLSKVDSFISEEMTKLLAKEVAPVNLWGEQVGKPTTIRDALAERAREFWNQKVNADGKATTNDYYSKPRHEYLFGKIISDEFAKAVSQDTINIIGALKTALKDNMSQTLNNKLDELIKVKIK